MIGMNSMTCICCTTLMARFIRVYEWHEHSEYICCNNMNGHAHTRLWVAWTQWIVFVVLLYRPCSCEFMNGMNSVNYGCCNNMNGHVHTRLWMAWTQWSVFGVLMLMAMFIQSYEWHEKDNYICCTTLRTMFIQSYEWHEIRELYLLC